MGFPKLNSIELAHYILAQCGEMSHLKLQKLVYYVEAWHLAIFEQPLFDDEFEAWMHGPVVRTVWEVFKNEKTPLYNVLKLEEGKKAQISTEIESKLSDDQIDLIHDVLKEYGDKSAYYLECLTHSEDPWIEARKGIAADAACKNLISKEKIKKYFSAAIYGEPAKAQTA